MSSSATTEYGLYISGEHENYLSNKTGIGRNTTTNMLEVEGNASKTASGSWLANSDRRIKKDISDISNSLSIIKNLHPVKFKYTDEWRQKHPSIQDKYYYNFIAQEFQQVFPESVQGSGEHLDGDADEILQIDTYNAQVTAIRAIQELLEIIESQKKEIDQLSSNNQEIKTQLETLTMKIGLMDNYMKRIEALEQMMSLKASEK
jgi:hypothetical protein